MPKNILEAKSISFSFENLEVLDKLSFSVQEGEFIALLGPSGVGKSVLLKLLVKLLEPSSGRVEYNFSSKVSLDTTMAFQSASLFNWMTVYENLEICMNHLGLLEEEKREKIEKYLEFSRLIEFAQAYPSELSGGMAQKVNLLRCFLSEAQLILMDEPLASVDSIQKMELQDFILNLWKKDKKTILYVTHDINEAQYMADKIFLLPFASKQKEQLREIKIDFKRPRDRIDLIKEEAYISNYQSILEFLKSELSHEAR